MYLVGVVGRRCLLTGLTMGRPLLRAKPHGERPWDASGLSELFIHTIRPFLRAPTGWQPVSQDNPGQNEQDKTTLWGLHEPLTKAAGHAQKHSLARERLWEQLNAMGMGPLCASPPSTAPPLALADHHPFQPLTRSICLLTVSPAKCGIRILPVQLFAVSNG